MPRFTRSRTLPAMAAGLIAVAVPATATAAVAGSASDHGNEFRQTNLISNRTDQGAQVVDPNVQNPWGLAMGPATPLWVANSHSGTATIYTINRGGTMVQKVPAMVTLPGGRA